MAKPILIQRTIPVIIFTTLLFFFVCTFLSSKNFSTYFASSSSSDCPPRPYHQLDKVLFPAGLCNCSATFPEGKPFVECQCPQLEASSTKEVVVREVEKPCPDPKPKQQPWWAEGKPWHYPVRFPRCSLDACFNFSRCSNMSSLKMFTYEDHNPPVRYFTNLNQTRWHTKNPDEACIFLVFLDTQSPWPKHPQELPHWNNGLNHALVTFADKWSQRGIPEDSIGQSSLVLSDAHETIFRPGFDVSIPLPPFYHFHELRHLKPSERKYLLTFKGLRYLGSHLRSTDSFRSIHNGEDIVVVTSCRHGTNDLARKENSSLGVHCEEDEELYSRYSSYSDLMNTTFGLVPAGVQPNSYRFGEVLGAGVIPVLIVDNYVKPFSNIVTWYRCVLQFPSTEIPRIVPTVRAMSRSQMEERQLACLRIYHSHFESESTLLESTVAALEERFLGAFPSFASHLVNWLLEQQQQSEMLWKKRCEDIWFEASLILNSNTLPVPISFILQKK